MPLQGTMTVFAIDGHRSVVAAAMLCSASSDVCLSRCSE